MAGRGILAEICTSHTQLKKSGISHTHTQSMRKFPIKTKTDSGNTHDRDEIYVISRFNTKFWHILTPFNFIFI